MLREVAGAVNASLDLPQVLRHILEVMREAFGFEHSMVLLPVDAELLEVRASIGYPDTGVGARVKLGEGPIGVAAKRRKLLRMAGMRSKVMYAEQVGAVKHVRLPGLPDVQSLVVVPMTTNDELVGVLSVESSEPPAFEPEDEKLLGTVANLAAAAIRNARLYQDLVEMHRSGDRFVPHEFVRFLDKASLKDLGRGASVNREMTILFSDLRSFTSMVEGMDPASTFDLLNRYFATMVPPIQEHRGFVDKFIGDAIMALFDSASADDAARAALAEHRALDHLNSQRAGERPLAMGIGLHTGPVTLGVVGSDERLSCTVYGDSVNLASRVESLTRHYGARVLLTGSTVAALSNPGDYVLRLVDRVRVKGKEAPVDLWESLAAFPQAERSARAPHDDLAEARAPYTLGEFSTAATALAGLLDDYPADPVVLLLLDRCKAFAVDAPLSWDGALRLDKK